MHALDPLFDRRHRRDATTAALGGLAAVTAVLLSILGATGMSSLRLIGFSAVVLLVLGLTAGAVWAVTAAATLLVIEWTFGLLAGSVLPEWAPYLAAGLYVLVELGVTVLERREVVEAPAEPPLRRIVGVLATSLVVWVVSALVLELSRFEVAVGALTQIAGVSAAAAIIATLSWLLRKRA